MIERYLDTEELKRLLAGLVVVVGAVMIAALFAVIVVPGLRNANKPAAPTPVAPVAGEPGWLDPTEFPPQRGREVPPVEPKTLIAYSPELAARGKQLFDANCVQCHGALGRGDGTAAGTMDPRPRNLASPEGWRRGHDLASIYGTLTEGIRDTSMPAFDYLSRRDRMALAHYVQALGDFPHSAPSPGALAALEKELAAPGGRTPNRIPVSQAMRRLEMEFAAPAPLKLGAQESGAGAQVLRRVLIDPARAAQTLAGSTAWRAGVSALAAGLLPGVPANGFSARLATLDGAEWRALYEELIGRAGP